MLASTEPSKIPRMAEITWQCVRYIFPHVSRRVVFLCSTAFCHEKDILEGLGLGVCSGFLTLAHFCAFRPVPDSQENAKEWRANSWDFRNPHVLHESTCRPAGSRHSQKQAWQAPCRPLADLANQLKLGTSSSVVILVQAFSARRNGIDMKILFTDTYGLFSKLWAPCGYRLYYGN